MKIRKIKNTAEKLKNGGRTRQTDNRCLTPDRAGHYGCNHCNFFRCGDDIYHDRQQYIQKYIQ